jgi:uncharacterized protein
MRVMVGPFVCAAVLASRLLASAQEPAPLTPLIVTTGVATITRAPDQAVIVLAVESRAKGSREAQQLNAQAMAAVQKKLADLRIAREAMRTLGLALDQEFDNTGGRRTPRGFVARNTVEVRLDDISRVGEVTDGAVEAGATSIGGVRFELRDRAGAEREALRRAVEDARARAEAAAAGAGRAVDRIVRIEDQRIEGGPPRPLAFAARAEVAPTTDVVPGTIEIHARVTLTAAMR